MNPVGKLVPRSGNDGRPMVGRWLDRSRSGVQTSVAGRLAIIHSCVPVIHGFVQFGHEPAAAPNDYGHTVLRGATVRGPGR